MTCALSFTVGAPERAVSQPRTSRLSESLDAVKTWAGDVRGERGRGREERKRENGRGR